ncbi:PilW family protein [Microbulbifer sp. SA54]|uniref:PilW family protein n=1 Tax=Microbulbifer sp. SA54 TaxID=3401577 RepID=UPI003AACA8CF
MNISTFSRQKGLSLIELMVGLALASVLLLGVLQIFDANRRTHLLQESLSRIQESGRIATDMLAKELRNAAFTGCVVDNEFLIDHLGTVGDYISGIDNATAQTAAIGGAEVLVGTDVLTVKGAFDACGGKGRISTNLGGNVIELTESCGLVVGQEVLIANCNAGDYTRVQEISGSAPMVMLTAEHGLGADYGPEAKVYRYYARTYFISRSGNLPGLYVSENGGAARELVPGIEDLQVRYGRASQTPEIVDIWGEPPINSAESEQVAAVRVQLLVAADERIGANQFEYTPLGGELTQSADDGRLRKVYSVLSKVRNRGNIK